MLMFARAACILGLLGVSVPAHAGTLVCNSLGYVDLHNAPNHPLAQSTCLAVPTPTLDEVGLFGLAAALGIAGLVMLIRRKK
jgi:hypothetical protein